MTRTRPAGLDLVEVAELVAYLLDVCVVQVVKDGNRVLQGSAGFAGISGGLAGLGEVAEASGLVIAVTELVA